MRRFQQLAVGGLAGAAVFWLFAKFGDESAKREAVAHGRRYVSDKPSRVVWAGIGASEGVLLVGACKVVRSSVKHRKLTGIVLLLPLTAAALYKGLEYLAAGAEAVDLVDNYGPGYPGDQRPLSNEAYWDIAGAAAEQRMLREGGWPPPAAADTGGLEAFGRQ